MTDPCPCGTTHCKHSENRRKPKTEFKCSDARAFTPEERMRWLASLSPNRP